MKIKVYVITNSSQEKVEFVGDDNTYKVWTHAKAIDGEANKNVIQLLSRFFDVTKSQIKLVSGLKAKIKIFEINK